MSQLLISFSLSFGWYECNWYCHSHDGVVYMSSDYDEQRDQWKFSRLDLRALKVLNFKPFLF